MSCRCPVKTFSNRSETCFIQVHGTYSRSSDSKTIRRFRCRKCGATFSTATGTPTYRHKKRRLNAMILKFLKSGVSMRQIARILGVHRTTVARKRQFWSKQGIRFQKTFLKKEDHEIIRLIQIDDVETFEHTKCKPLSITMAVTNQRVILGAKVSKMPCKGRLAEFSRKKYGLRADERRQNIAELLKELSGVLRKDVTIVSDKSPFYPNAIQKYFPRAVHTTHRGRAPARTGQGELKKGAYDPLFSINHTAAKMRDLIKPLTRKTWCTTKAKFGLEEHLNIFIAAHNSLI